MLPGPNNVRSQNVDHTNLKIVFDIQVSVESTVALTISQSPDGTKPKFALFGGPKSMIGRTEGRENLIQLG